MNKIWVRNVDANYINEVGLLQYGSEPWENAYLEMIDRGYQFELGEPRGFNKNSNGLYLINPLEIEIKESKYDIVNRLNQKIENLQKLHTLSEEKIQNEEQKKEQITHNYSLDELFEKLEKLCKDVQFTINKPFMMEEQQKVYNQFIELFKVDTSEKQENIIKKFSALKS